MNNCNDNLIKKAMKKIKADEKYKPQCIGTIVGPTGPIGPTGPANVIDVIMIDNEVQQNVDTNQPISLGTLENNVGTSLKYNGTNTITLEENGTYLILFRVLATDTNGDDIGIAINVNGQEAEAGKTEFTGTQNNTYQLNLSFILTATAATTITITNITNQTLQYNNANLIITKLF